MNVSTVERLLAAAEALRTEAESLRTVVEADEGSSADQWHALHLLEHGAAYVHSAAASLNSDLRNKGRAHVTT